MNIVGIDMSLTHTGLALVEGGKLVEIGSAKSSPVTKGGKDDTLEDRQRRVFGVANEILDFVTYQPVTPVDMVVVEAPSYGSKHGNQHDRSGLWWLVVNALIGDRIPVAMVSPQGRAKYGTGKGNSSKATVLAFVREVYTDLLGKRIPSDNEADAILLAAMGSRKAGYPIEPFGLHQDNLAAMDGALWPAL